MCLHSEARKNALSLPPVKAVHSTCLNGDKFSL